MRLSILLSVVFLASVVVAQTGTNCSYATMTPIGSTYGCDAAQPPVINTNYLAPTSNTAEDQCWRDGGTTAYFSATSTVSGTGNCAKNSAGTWVNCPAINEMESTDGTSATDYNRMYNRMYDTYLGGWNCYKSGAWRQDLRQCSPIWCYASSCCSSGYCPSRYICGTRCTCEFASPIVIDTTGHGFHLTSAADGVAFDIAGSGLKLKLSWTAADSGNAWLALDRNGNGTIDSGKELFGDFTEQPPPPKGEIANGYLALREFDKPKNGGNGDGIIDWRDTVYSKLRLWIDANHDGISQPSELHTLRELGVFSIGLQYHEEPFVDQYGNAFKYVGRLNPNPLDGKSQDGRNTYDVLLVADKTTATQNCTQPKQVVLLDKLQ